MRLSVFSFNDIRKDGPAAFAYGTAIVPAVVADNFHVSGNDPDLAAHKLLADILKRAPAARAGPHGLINIQVFFLLPAVFVLFLSGLPFLSGFRPCFGFYLKKVIRKSDLTGIGRILCCFCFVEQVQLAGDAVRLFALSAEKLFCQILDLLIEVGDGLVLLGLGRLQFFDGLILLGFSSLCFFKSLHQELVLIIQFGYGILHLNDLDVARSSRHDKSPSNNVILIIS